MARQSKQKSVVAPRERRRLGEVQLGAMIRTSPTSSALWAPSLRSRQPLRSPAPTRRPLPPSSAAAESHSEGGRLSERAVGSTGHPKIAPARRHTQRAHATRMCALVQRCGAAQCMKGTACHRLSHLHLPDRRLLLRRSHRLEFAQLRPLSPREPLLRQQLLRPAEDVDAAALPESELIAHPDLSTKEDGEGMMEVNTADQGGGGSEEMHGWGGLEAP